MLNQFAKAKIIAASQYAKEQAYWFAKLGQADPSSALPFDFEEKRRGMSTELFHLKDDVQGKVWELCQESFHRLHMVLHTAMIILLKKYTSKKDLTIGTSIYTQTNQGKFLNTALPVRSDVPNEITFKDLLQQVRQAILEANENQNFPVEALYLLLGLSFKDDQAHPFFNTVLLLKNIQNEVYLKEVRSELCFCFCKTTEGIACEIRYNPSKYATATIHRFFNYFQNILEQCMQNTDTPVKLITGADQLYVINVLGKGIRRGLPNQSVLELIEEVSLRTPEKIAIYNHEKTVSFKQLHEWSNALAVFLIIKCDIKKGDHIGICIERSELMIVSILAILKAGAVFVPVENDYPAARIKQIIKESQCKIILADQESMHHFIDQTERLVITNVADHFTTPTTTYPFPKVSRIDPAYVLYTSGSTGNPKGCEISHNSLLNYIQWANISYQMDQQDVIPLFTSLGFDFTLTSIFCPLSTGRSIRIFHGNNDLPAMLQDIFGPNRNVTFVKLTPSHINILGHLKPSLTKVTTVVAGGESLLPKHIKTLKRWNPEMKIFNEYGPTEATVGCIVSEVKDSSTVLIGKPIDNTEVYLLNEDQEVLPQGAVGEIYIGGECLANCYYNHPELTIRKFVNIPYLSKSKLYRTGDRGRYNGTGDMEYLGRTDRQVKVNGYRIELDEVEQHLMNLEKIQEAVVDLKTDIDGQSYLVAFYTSNDQLSSEYVRSQLRMRLPLFMIPSFLLQTKKIPLNAHGKVDLRALPDEKALLKNNPNLVHPRNEIEQNLATVWRKVLKTDEIGIDDNFFEIGGNSLSLIALHAELSQTYSSVSVPDLFKYNSIRSLQEHLTRDTEARSISSIEV